MALEGVAEGKRSAVAWGAEVVEDCLTADPGVGHHIHHNCKVGVRLGSQAHMSGSEDGWSMEGVAANLVDSAEPRPGTLKEWRTKAAA